MKGKAMKQLYIMLLAMVGALGAGNLDLVTGTWLGGAGVDEGTGVQIGIDRTVIYSGKLNTTVNYGITPTAINGGGEGVVVRFSAEGAILSITRFTATVDDIEVDKATGEIAVIGAFGTMLLTPDASAKIWEKPPLGSTSGSTLGVGRRVAIGAGGVVAALYGKRFVVYDKQGASLGSGLVPRDYANDIAVDGINRQVVAAGFNQHYTCSNPVQVAAVDAFTYQGQHKWSSFGFAANRENFCDGVAGNQMADTRGMLVTTTNDGYIYFTGESAGGNSIFRYDGKTLTNAKGVQYDKYTHAYQTSANHITYFARMDKDGLVQRGQFILPRLSSGNGNTIRPNALYVDEDDRVYIGGVSAYSIDTTGGNIVDGKRTSPAGGFVFISNALFTARQLWTTFSTEEYAATVNGVAGSKGISAIASTAQKGTLITTNNAQQSAAVAISQVNTEGHLAIWDGPSQWSGIKITITNPTNNAVLNAGDDLLVQAHIEVEGETIDSVEWFLDGVLFASTTTASLPSASLWQATIPALAQGHHSISLLATTKTNSQKSIEVPFLAKGVSTPSQIIIHPSSLDIVAGVQYDFEAFVYDQYGLKMEGETVAWSGDGGAITSQGRYTAGSIHGLFSVTASIDLLQTTAAVQIVDGIYENIQVNFQNSGNSLASGFLADWGQVYGVQDNGFAYGWGANNTDNSRFRSSEDNPQWATFNHMQKDGKNRTDHYWEIAVPNGKYSVTVGAGDAEYFGEPQLIQVEGVTVVQGLTTASEPYLTGTAQVTVNDGRLTVHNDPLQLASSWNKLSWITIDGLDPTSDSIRVESPVMQQKHVVNTQSLFAPLAIQHLQYRDNTIHLQMSGLSNQHEVQVFVFNGKGELQANAKAQVAHTRQSIQIPMHSLQSNIYFIMVRNGVNSVSATSFKTGS
jgi:hypothetical protein